LLLNRLYTFILLIYHWRSTRFLLWYRYHVQQIMAFLWGFRLLPTNLGERLGDMVILKIELEDLIDKMSSINFWHFYNMTTHNLFIPELSDIDLDFVYPLKIIHALTLFYTFVFIFIFIYWHCSVRLMWILHNVILLFRLFRFEYVHSLNCIKFYLIILNIKHLSIITDEDCSIVETFDHFDYNWLFMQLITDYY